MQGVQRMFANVWIWRLEICLFRSIAIETNMFLLEIFVNSSIDRHAIINKFNVLLEYSDLTFNSVRH